MSTNHKNTKFINNVVSDIKEDIISGQWDVYIIYQQTQ